MNPNERLNVGENPVLPGTRSFSEAVAESYEALVPETFNFTWADRVQHFIRQGVDSLWTQFNQASTGERMVYGGLALAGAYVGYQVLRAAVEGVFDLGRWLLELINGIRQNSIELILSVTLGATVIGLIPLLYQGVARGNLSLSQVFAAWDEDGFEGLLNLLREHFPEGVRNMSEDVREFIRETIGAARFDEWFSEVETPPEVTVTPEPTETPVPTVEGEAVEPVAEPVPVDTSFLSADTQAYLDRFRASRSGEDLLRLIDALIDNEGGVVVHEGSIYLLDAVDELVSLATLLGPIGQYGVSVQDVFEAVQNHPEEAAGALVRAYFAEVPKFMIIASTMEVFHRLRYGRSMSLLRMLGVSAGWGVTIPYHLVRNAARVVGTARGVARFAADGVVFLSRTGANLAKLTTQGSLLLWQSGRFVSQEAIRQATRLGLGRALGSAVNTTYIRGLGRQVTNFTSRSFGRRLLAVAGWRGAATGVLWADDATGVGVLNDVVAVGMTAWLAVDVYELIQITREAHRFGSLMDEQQTLAVTNVAGNDETTIARLAEVEAEAEAWGPDQALAFLSSMPRAEFTLTRENGRSEVYLMVRGQILSVTILEGGEALASFSEEDVEALSTELPPPAEFEAWEIDYEADSDTLYSHYRLAFAYVLNETGWSALDYIIHDEQTIEVRRRTSQQAVFIHRVEDRWFIGADRETSFDLFQAISMANLINRVEDLLLEELRVPRGESPFYVDSNGIYLDRPLNDTQILSGEDESWYHQFYQGQLGLNPETITDALNWHYRDTMRPRLEQNIDDYMEDFIPA